MTNTCRRIMLTGIAGGFIGGAVKMGWEALVPPRTPERDEEPPPMTLLHKLNLSENVKNAKYTYNQNDIPITVMGVHYRFSIANAFVYALLTEKCPKFSTFRGGAFGITPEVEDLPKEERLSELFGHMNWMNSIEFVRLAIK
ncbi:DUF1440 domain-containing protein [Staphylococcus saccharolyticus]|uniref:DUF1440 domain-containing protein n=1 Tax=Staphylococcus saccharolyticus TaxID=33028 RepID=UPI0032DED801